MTTWEAARRYLPALLNAAVITLVLSSLSMLLAVTVGILIAGGRVYGPAPLRAALTAWVEIIRGTPLLLQLFVLYFGLATVVQLPQPSLPRSSALERVLIIEDGRITRAGASRELLS